MENENTNAVAPRKFSTKKAILVFVVVLFCAAGAFFAKPIIKIVRALPNTVVSFSPATKMVANSQSFTLDAMIDPRTNQVTAVELHFTYDKTKFRLDSISTTGSPFSVTLQAASIDNTAGTASIIVAIPASNPPVPVTTSSKLATLTFYSLAGVSNSSIGFATTSQASALGEGSVNVITTRTPAQVTVDSAAPTGGSITYTNGYLTTASVALTAADGTDSVSGVNTSTRIFKRRSATMTNNNCGTYGSWTTITPSGTYPNFTDTTVANGNCYQYQYLVSDNVGNQATYTGSSTVKIDTVAPSIVQVTAVPSPTNDTTPNYTFSANETGTIIYGGDCSSGTTSAVSGNNTITFNTLTSATHSNCTIKVTDPAGNQSSTLNVNSFIVDATAPAGGSITYTNGYSTTTSVALTVSDGTDSLSGINTSTRTIQRRSATLTGTSCGTYGSWSNLTPSGTYPNFTDTTVANGNCYQYQYLVSDNVGNQATYTNSSVIKVDTAAPVIAQVTPVPSPTNNPTPSYTFSSTEAGTITYGGDCSSGTTAAVSGNNTVTFNALTSAIHSNCTIKVADAAGNQSNTLAVNTFTVDAVAPTITSVSSNKPNGTYGTGAVIDIVVNFSEAVTSSGNVVVTLDTSRNCSFTVSNATSGTCNYTVESSDSSNDLTTISIAGIIKDQANNALTNFTPATNLGDNKNIVISAILPVLSQVTAVPDISTNTAPAYTFSSTKAGNISFGGDCSSATSAAVSGNNTVTFNTLSIGAYSNCTITVTDSSGNVSLPLAVNSFTITYQGDFNQDKSVDIYDYNIIIANFGNTSCGNAADADNNCKVDIFDYNILMQDFGKKI